MANQTDIILLDTTPLNVSDAAALRADFIPRTYWEPAIVLETPTTTVVTPSLLAAAGDLWKIEVAPRSAIPGFVWQLLTFEVQLVCTDDANFDALFNDDLAWAAQGLPALDTSQMFMRVGTLSTVARWLKAGGVSVGRVRAFSPGAVGMPSRPYQATSATLASNTMGIAHVEIGTWNAVAAGNTEAWINARWLGFPVGAQRSGGFYTPSLFHTLQ